MPNDRAVYAAVTLHVKVPSVRELYRSALRHAIAPQGCGMSRSAARELLGAAKAPDIDNCLRLLLDPGMSPDGVQINDSDSEHWDA